MRVSVSDIDSYISWKENDEISFDELLARLRKQSPTSEAMLAGIALHKALEDATPGEVDSLEANGYTFLFELDFEIALTTLREVKATKVYQTPSGPIRLVGKVDGLDGDRIDDHKTTSRLDPERYVSGYQWRFYLDIFNAKTFRWNVIELRENTKLPNTYFVNSITPIEQVRYPELEKDCQLKLNEFAEFAYRHLPERIISDPAES